MFMEKSSGNDILMTFINYFGMALHLSYGEAPLTSHGKHLSDPLFEKHNKTLIWVLTKTSSNALYWKGK